MENHSIKEADLKFSELYRRNVNLVYRLSYLYLKNPSDADDAVQSIFLKLIENRRSFQDLEHEKAWIIVLTKNYCKDILKSWWKSHRVDLDSLPETPNWEEDREQGRLLGKLLLLPEKYKMVLYLYYYEEYSIKEMSRLLSRKESTIQTQLAKGRERLKLKLGGESIGKESSQGAV